MQHYETDSDLTYSEVMRFTKWFDDNIGTEYEVNESDEFTFYIMFFDLTPNEVRAIRKFEVEELNR